MKVAQIIATGAFLYESLYVPLLFSLLFLYGSDLYPVVWRQYEKIRRYVPGSAGKKEAEYIDNVLTRLTFSGGVYVSLVCVLPTFGSVLYVPFYFGGPALDRCWCCSGHRGKIEAIADSIRRLYEKGQIARRRGSGKFGGRQ